VSACGVRLACPAARARRPFRGDCFWSWVCALRPSSEAPSSSGAGARILPLPSTVTVVIPTIFSQHLKVNCVVRKHLFRCPFDLPAHRHGPLPLPPLHRYAPSAAPLIPSNSPVRHLRLVPSPAQPSPSPSRNRHPPHNGVQVPPRVQARRGRRRRRGKVVPDHPADPEPLRRRVRPDNRG